MTAKLRIQIVSTNPTQVAVPPGVTQGNYRYTITDVAGGAPIVHEDAGTDVQVDVPAGASYNVECEILTSDGQSLLPKVSAPAPVAVPPEATTVEVTLNAPVAITATVV